MTNSKHGAEDNLKTDPLYCWLGRTILLQCTPNCNALSSLLYIALKNLNSIKVLLGKPIKGYQSSPLDLYAEIQCFIGAGQRKKMLLFATLLLLLQFKCPFASVPGIHCVVPADYPPSSPSDPDQPCLTLDQYAELNDFTSGTTLQFLPGNHSLELTLNLTEISSITLTRRYSNSTVNIICTNVGMIRCTNVTGLKVEGLRFILAYEGNKSASAITFINCIEILIASATFEGSEKGTGRATSLQNSQATIWKCDFESNIVSDNGGAIFMKSNTSLTINGSSFTKNQARRGGGAVYASTSTLLLYNNNFTNNNASVRGGAIWTLACTIQMKGHHMFQENYCDVDDDHECLGGALYSGSNLLFILGEVHFLANEASSGGAIYMSSTNATFNGNTTLTGNTVFRYYGAGGAMYIDTSKTTFIGNVTIENNTGEEGGGIRAITSLVVFQGNCSFINNTAHHGGGLSTSSGIVSIQGPTLFLCNQANHFGGALIADGTTVEVKDRLNFTHNSAAVVGGAMYFAFSASLNITPQDCSYPMISSSFNSAEKRGGFIYIEDSATNEQCYYEADKNFTSSQTLPYCFLQIMTNTSSLFRNCSLIDSSYDSAEKGRVLYGGLLDRCKTRQGDLLGLAYFNNKLFNFHPKGDSPVTSLPYELCFCEEEESSDCVKSLDRFVYKGQTFTVPLRAKAQVGTTSTTVFATTLGSEEKLGSSQIYQPLPNNSCLNLSYTVYSDGTYGAVHLYPVGTCQHTEVGNVQIKVKFLHCPVGFADSGEVCTCVERLRHFPFITCNIADTPYFTKRADSNFWMGFYTNTTYQGLILSKSCPVEYCKQGSVNITTDNPDSQCDLYRTGLLCGACAANQGHSLMLGGPQCQVCPNTHLALLLPFAAAGVALVVFLTSLRLTVATGTLNSIILYANIVQVNRNLIFLRNARNLLTVFLAWMNLDLGFQTCFYDGLDAYALTWLQFAFPLYVWLIIGLVIFISRYSITVSKLFGSNPVAVLATLLLMSYTKILKIIIEVYALVKLDYPDNKTATMWLKDANVPYLESKHLFLAIVTSVILVFLFVPYTLLLLLGPQLYRFTDKRHFRWLNRLKPLLDSYYAPYKNHTRYWTGFLLLVRCALYIIFAFASTDTNLLTIVLTFTAIGLITCYLRVYSNKPVNLIEACIYMNLIVLSATALTGRNAAGLVYFLVALVFTIMILLCAHQFYLLYIAKTAPWQKLKNKWLEFRKNSKALISEDKLKPDSSLDEHKPVTKTVIELREPLLDD